MQVLIPYRKKNKWGFCTPDKKIIIPCIYQWTAPFCEGLAKTRNYNKWGFINKSGHPVIRFKYDTEDDFSEGLASVGIINKIIVPNETNKNNPLEYEMKFGYIDRSGKIIIPFKYDSAKRFSEGIASVNIGAKYSLGGVNNEYGKWGLIDNTGKEILPCIFDEPIIFSEDLAAVSKNKKYGYVTKTGHQIIPCIYDFACKFSEGLAAVKFADILFKTKIIKGLWGLIDRTGKIVSSDLFENIGGIINGISSAKIFGNWGAIDKSGKEVVPFQYDAIGNYSEGLIAIKKDGKWGYVDNCGKTVIPLLYDNASDFSEGLAAIHSFDNINGWGYIDKTGKIIFEVENSYDSCGDFINDIALVWNFDYEGFPCIGVIDKTGKEIIECKFSGLGPFIDNFAPASEREIKGEDERGEFIISRSKFFYINRNGSEYYED